MKSFNVFAIFCLFHGVVIAQKSVEPGYLLMNNRDTVRGLIEINPEAELCKSVHFKRQGEAFKEYKPPEISGFGIGYEVYQSVGFVNTAEDSVKTIAFLKQLVTGEYYLYAYTQTTRRFYLLQKDTTQYFLYDRVTRNTGLIDQESNYYNYLHFISVNCGQIANQYDRVSFNDEDMAAFVLKVDNCISQGKATSLYQKPKTILTPNVFVGGFPVPGMTQFTASFTLQFSVPRVDKKTFVNVGLNYANTVVETLERADNYSQYTLITHNQIFSLPVTLQYNFTSTRIQPYLYAGASAAYLSKTTNSYSYDIPRSEKKFGMALVLGIGIEAKITAHWFIRADWRYELIMQYPAIGIEYRF
jgi:opacity protein-like surface antigen